MIQEETDDPHSENIQQNGERNLEKKSKGQFSNTAKGGFN